MASEDKEVPQVEGWMEKDEVEDDVEDVDGSKKRKRRKKKPVLSTVDKQTLEEGIEKASQANGSIAIEMIQKEFEELALKDDPEGINKKHEFWDNQPVNKLTEVVTEGNGPLEEKTLADVKKTARPLPKELKWSSFDITNEAELEEVYVLLRDHYVTDDDEMFRFDYSKDFLKWALTPPGWTKKTHVAIRSVDNNKILATITGVPADIRIYGKGVQVTEINFLCVHKLLREQRMAPVLIEEVTRRVNSMGVWQAVYTAGVMLPRPLTSARYFHRTINCRKLVECGFSQLGRMPLNLYEKRHALPKKPEHNLRPMKKSDVRQVTRLLTLSLAEHKLAVVLRECDVAHWLLPRDNVVFSYVIEDENQKITDFASFYTVPSTILSDNTTLHAAYAYYTVPTSMSLLELMADVLVLARDVGMDVFNCLNIGRNDQFIEPLKFGAGDGNLQYYLFNWTCPAVKPEDIGLIML